MALPQPELLAALFTAYRGDTTLQGLITGAQAPNWNIFDAVPINQAFPYVAINDISGVPGTLMTMPAGKAHDLLIQIDVLSQYPGFKEAQAIASRIDTLTNEVSFTMAGFANPYTLINNYKQKVEPDGITRRVMLEYRFMTSGG